MTITNNTKLNLKLNEKQNFSLVITLILRHAADVRELQSQELRTCARQRTMLEAQDGSVDLSAAQKLQLQTLVTQGHCRARRLQDENEQMLAAADFLINSEDINRRVDAQKRADVIMSKLTESLAVSDEALARVEQLEVGLHLIRDELIELIEEDACHSAEVMTAKLDELSIKCGSIITLHDADENKERSEGDDSDDRQTLARDEDAARDQH